MTENNNNSTVDRRSLLRSTSAVGLTLGGLSQTASAQESLTGKSVRFSELKLTYDVSLQEVEGLHYPTWTVDDTSQSHLVDHGQSKLYLNDNRNREIDIPNREAVVANEGYFSPPTKFGGSSPAMITTEIHSDFRAKSALSIKDNGYTHPEVSVRSNTGGLSIAAEKQEATVSEGREEALVLPDREITVEAFEFADEEPPQRTDNLRAAPLRNYRDVQVTVTPIVRVRNHGNIDISKVSSPSPVPNPLAPAPNR